MTLSLLSNSSDRFPVALASPLERLLDGSWYAAAPRLRREKPHDLASLIPRCRLRSARPGGTEGAFHGSEDCHIRLGHAEPRSRCRVPRVQGGGSLAGKESLSTLSI